MQCLSAALRFVSQLATLLTEGKEGGKERGRKGGGGRGEGKEGREGRKKGGREGEGGREGREGGRKGRRGREGGGKDGGKSKFNTTVQSKYNILVYRGMLSPTHLCFHLD